MQAPTILCWAAAVSTAVLTFLHIPLGLVRIVPGCRPPGGYWRRRPVLNLLENNLGMALNTALAVVVGLVMQSGEAAAWPLLGVNAAYAVLIVGLTPRDRPHALPTGVAAAEYVAAYLAA